MKFIFVDTVDEVLEAALEPVKKTHPAKTTTKKKSEPKKAKKDAKSSTRRR